MAKISVTRAIVIILIITIGVIICSCNGELFQKTIFAESLTPSDDTTIENAIRECVKGIEKNHKHNKYKQELIFDCIYLECLKHYQKHESKSMSSCIKEFVSKYRQGKI
ncbi:hypothetical protein PIB30_052763 [Stylosanthes scabra]|uniref:Uncharacterized protein n=1 Tax=Stylosanthes scabra TaxID=79078 RepID=A0ABU6ZH27_9FABA|nr:hypothetical protein [Stylosanthes scabra]